MASPALPNLNDLHLNHKKPRTELTPDAANGVYCLDRPGDVIPCDSSIVLVRKALPLSDADTEELEEFMSDDVKVARTPNHPWGGYVRRKQATFGAEYKFGNQKSTHIGGSPLRWPRAVQEAMRQAQQFAEQRGIAHELYNVVHVNYYPMPEAWLAPHADDEPELIKGLPILSYTLLAGNKKARPFDIHATQKVGKKLKAIKPPIASIDLDHGDLVVMQGSMQEFFFHGVPEAKPKKEYKDARRLNLTVRCFYQPPDEEDEEDDEDEEDGPSSSAKVPRREETGEEEGGAE